MARSVQDTSCALVAAGMKVDILAYRFGSPDLPWATPPEGLTVKLLKPPALPIYVSVEMKAALRERLSQADVLHVHGMWQPLNNYACALARKLNKPYVCSIRGMLDPWSMSQKTTKKTVYYKLFEDKRLSFASAIHFTAEAERTKAAPWTPKQTKTVVVPNVVNLEQFKTLPDKAESRAAFPDIPASGKWVLFLSRIHVKKGLHVLVDAVAKLLPAIPDLHLLIAGSGDEAYIHRIKQQIKDSGLGQNIHFIGMVQKLKKVQAYRAADVFALPTSQENFGLVFPESLACETPVLITKDVDIYGEILEANAGLLINQTPENVAEKLKELLVDHDRAKQMGINGRKWVYDTLESSRTAMKWKEIYGEIVGAKSQQNSA